MISNIPVMIVRLKTKSTQTYPFDREFGIIYAKVSKRVVL